MTETKLSEDELRQLVASKGAWDGTTMEVIRRGQYDGGRWSLEHREFEWMHEDLLPSLFDAARELLDLRAENRQLREALKRYGVHDGQTSEREGWCAILNTWLSVGGIEHRCEDPCDCGLSAALGEQP